MQNGEQPPGAEPPGRIDTGVDTTEASSTMGKKPVRINVQVNFLEMETGQRRYLLRKPLEDALHSAAVVEETLNDSKHRKTIAAVQGVLADRVNGHVMYSGVLSVAPEMLEQVEENVSKRLEILRGQFRISENDVTIKRMQPEDKILEPKSIEP